MLPACRTGGEGFAIPTFDLVPSDVRGFMEELWEFQSTFHDCFARTDIEQPLTRRNLIKPTDLFPKQAKDFDLYLVQPFNEVVQLALHGHADAMNPFE